VTTEQCSKVYQQRLLKVYQSVPKKCSEKCSEKYSDKCSEVYRRSVVKSVVTSVGDYQESVAKSVPKCTKQG
jgi:hypothetical protein